MGGKKAAGNQPSAKTEKKAKEKVVEDKTFGLKNKNKSTKVQQFVKSVQTQVLHGQQKGGARAMEEGKFQAKKDKKDKEAANALLASLFKGAQALGKGGKFEDVAQQTINFYKDPREGTANMPEDTIITCKHFLDAVEDDKYGWRWECPNAAVKCTYLHRLPEGFVILSKKERAAQKAEEMKGGGGDQSTLEEKIEEERALLKHDDLTPVTKDSFFAWKARRAQEKQKALEDQVKLIETNARAKKAAGKAKNIMNGRALFSYKPELFVDDDNAVDDTAYEEEEEVAGEESKNPKEESKIDSSLFEAGAEDEDVDFD